MRIFFDTNVLFSAFGFRGLSQELFRECSLHHQVIVSTYVIDELTRVMENKLAMDASDLKEIREQLIINCELSDGQALLDIAIRDKADLPIVSAAVAAGADVLVSGDKDLLVLHIPQIQILSPRQLHNLLLK